VTDTLSRVDVLLRRHRERDDLNVDLPHAVHERKNDRDARLARLGQGLSEPKHHAPFDLVYDTHTAEEDPTYDEASTPASTSRTIWVRLL
jgi:hypothetical protein